jgi:hypothetical protein
MPDGLRPLDIVFPFAEATGLADVLDQAANQVSTAADQRATAAQPALTEAQGPWAAQICDELASIGVRSADLFGFLRLAAGRVRRAIEEATRLRAQAQAAQADWDAELRYELTHPRGPR